MAIDITKELEKLYSAKSQQAESLSQRLAKIDEYNKTVGSNVRGQMLDFSNRPAGYNPLQDFESAINLSETNRDFRAGAAKDLEGTQNSLLALLEKIGAEQRRGGGSGSVDPTAAYLGAIKKAGSSVAPMQSKAQAPQAMQSRPQVQSTASNTPAPQPQQQASFLGELAKDLTKPLRTVAEGISSAGQLLGNESFRQGLMQDPIATLTGQNKNIKLNSQPADLGSVGLTQEERKKIETSPVKESGKLAANVASYAIPFGKGANILSKAVAPGATVGALQGLSRDNVTPESLTQDTLLGAAIPGGAAVLGKGASALKNKVASALGSKASNTAKSLALKGLKPTPSQQTTFFKETGEKLDNFLQKRGLQGAGFEDIAQSIEPLQAQFDKVVTSKELRVGATDIASRFNQKIAALQKSTLPVNKQKAQALQMIRDNFITKYGNKKLSSQVVTTLRREVDDNIKQFTFDESTKNVLNLTRDIYQDSVRTSADKAGLTVDGKSLKEAGTELSKLYKLLGIAEKQQFVGTARNPLSLSELLGAGAGGAVGGFPGMIAGAAATTAVNNPAVIRGASKGMEQLASILSRSEGVLPELGQKAGQTLARTGQVLPSGQNTPENPNNNNPETNSINQLNNSVSQGVNDGLPETLTGYSLAELQQARELARQAGDTKGVKAIQDMFQEELKYQQERLKDGGDSRGKPTELDKKFELANRQTASALDLLESNNLQSGPIQNLMSQLNETTGRQDSKLTEFKSKIAIARTAARSALLGASVPPAEAEALLDFLLDFKQPTPILRDRMRTLSNVLEDYRVNISGGGSADMQGVGVQ